MSATYDVPYDARDRLLNRAGEAINLTNATDFSFEPMVNVVVPELADGCAIEIFGAGAAGRIEVWSPFRQLLEDLRPVALLGDPDSDDASSDGAPIRIRMGEEDASLLRNMGVRSVIGIPIVRGGSDEGADEEEGDEEGGDEEGRDEEERPGEEEGSGQRLAGVLSLLMTRSGRSFGEADVALFEEVGRELGSSLRGAPLESIPPMKVARGEHLDLVTRRHCTGQLQGFTAERETLARRKQQEAIARLARFALSENDLMGVMAEAIRLIRDALDHDIATVLEFLPDEEAFVVRATEGFPQEIVDALRIPSRHSSLSGYTLDTGGPVILEDTRDETRFDILDILLEHGVRSGASVVIEGVGRPWGVLAAHGRSPRRLSESDVEFMQTMADVLGQAVERDISLQEVDAARREFEALAENAPDIILRFDRAARCTYANSSVRQLGLSPSRVISRTLQELPCGPENAEAMGQAILDVIDGTGAFTDELTLTGSDGDRRVFECRLTAEPRPGAPPETALAILRDVTERRVSDDWLRYQATLLDTVGEGVIAIDPRGRIIYWNRQAELQFGWSFEEVLERELLEVIIVPESRPWARSRMLQVSRGTPWAGEAQLLRKDGTTFPAYVSAAPVRDEAGDIIGMVAASTDLTRRTQLEEQLRQAQKMEAVGRLAGGVAHDFNNILTTVAGYTDLLMSELRSDVPAREFAEEIDAATDRAIRLTAQLLAFSRKQVLQPRLVDPRAAIREMEKLLRRVIGENIELTLRDDGSSGAVLADPTQLEQVILNLAVNARDAMPLGGTLAIILESVVHEKPVPVGQEDLPPGRYVVISVSDTGTGIPPEVQPHIFEPFYTTKPKGRGTGLGLATVYGIVQQSGGGISIRSVPGEGTTFSVHLPEAGGSVEPEEEEEKRETAPASGQRTVLVVEDEPSVRLLLTKLLPRLGYRVLEAGDGAEALEKVREQAGSIDIVLTDVVMPVMGGPELAVHLGREHPELPVLFMSGYTDEALADRNVVDPGVTLMKKPFTVDELRERVREALSARGKREV